MTRRMLINAQRPEELRVAIVQGNVLENYKVDVAEAGLTRGNIYRGVIASIQPSLNAAFIDYGAERHGFLAIQDVVPDAYYRRPSGGHPRIDEVLEKNKPIVVQVEKDPIGTKGAALTTSLSLAGRYLVLTPFEDTRGVSRKVEDEDTRKKLKGLANGLDLPDGCGVILRTNALGQTKITLNRDLSALLRLWKRVQTAAMQGKGTRLLYTDQDLILQALRDYLDTSIEEVLVDDDEAFHKAKAYIEAFMPRSKTRLIRYAERIPLFSRYDLESQIDRIYERRVELPSGGSIVIDPTEALTAIDVNSGRSTRAATQEETALNTNVEAAAEVARQLRLRDIGGIVVVDFIDMRSSKGQRKVEKVLKDAMKVDKARSTIGRVSPNGLLEINRQRIQQALQLRTHRPCPTCNGVGRLASEEMVCLSLLRRVEARAATGSIQGARIGLHPELADALQNNYRRELADLETEFDIEIEVIATAGLHRPDEKIDWRKREKPVPPPKPKQAAITFQPWDLASLEDEDDDEDEDFAAEGEDHGEENGQAASGESAESAESDAAARKRRRRRGGRKRKKKAPGENGNGVHETGSNDQAASGAPGENEPAETYLAPVLEGPAFVDEPADLFDEDDDEDDDDDLEEGVETVNADGTVAAAGAPGTKKRRRRRRRRK
ncbi:MAG: Rne/Rng family ribonuclease [Thermoanaerobaculia bacterium]